MVKSSFELGLAIRHLVARPLARSWLDATVYGGTSNLGNSFPDRWWRNKYL